MQHYNSGYAKPRFRRRGEVRGALHDRPGIMSVAVSDLHNGLQGCKVLGDVEPTST
jgi:hypothetical protein